MKNNRIKLIAASVALMSSFSAVAGLGGLNVQSHLGENFSGTITVTGEEAQALLNGGKAAISNKNLRASVRKSGDNAIVRVHSSKPVQEPVLVFNVGVGAQTREYTAIIDPAGYSAKSSPAAVATRAPSNDTFTAEEEPKRTRRVEVAREEPVRKERAKPAVAKPAKPTARNTQVETVSSNIQYGRNHHVRNGETLLGIASRIRPQGLTVSETAQALVNANPKVFINQNADRMLAGKVLNIPSREELLRLAGEKPTVKVSPADMAEETPNTVDTAVVKEQTQPEQVKPAEAMPSENNKAVENTDKAATEQAASAAAASDVQASATASDVATASEATPEVASNSQPATAEPATESAPEEEGGLWRWLLIGGAAVIAAWLLLKLAGKRKAIDGNEIEEDVPVKPQPKSDEIKLNNIDASAFSQTLSESPDAKIIKAAATTSAAAAAVVAATKAPQAVADDELDMEDDFDDDIFFTQKEETPSLAKQNDIQFDLSGIDNSQNAIPSGAITLDKETEARRDLDWDTVESTDSVYEPEPVNPYAQTAQAAPAVQETAQEWVTSRPVGEQTFSAVEPVAEEKVEEAHVEAEAETDPSWDFFAAPAQEEPVKAAEPFAETFKEAATVDTLKETVQDLEPLDFVMPEAEEAEEEITPLSAPVLESTSDVKEPEPFDISKDEDLSFQDSEDLQAETQVVETIETIDEPIEWNAVDTTPSSESSFISESVGMTAPLEAKYELAKMYVEIGDPEAARETLQELLEESNGNILSKAKALLKELDS